MSSKPQKNVTQADKFKEVARELECDEDEAAFYEKLRVVANPAGPKNGDQAAVDKKK